MHFHGGISENNASILLNLNLLKKMVAASHMGNTGTQIVGMHKKGNVKREKKKVVFLKAQAACCRFKGVGHERDSNSYVVVKS